MCALVQGGDLSWLKRSGIAGEEASARPASDGLEPGAAPPPDIAPARPAFQWLAALKVPPNPTMTAYITPLVMNPPW